MRQKEYLIMKVYFNLPCFNINKHNLPYINVIIYNGSCKNTDIKGSRETRRPLLVDLNKE